MGAVETIALNAKNMWDDAPIFDITVSKTNNRPHFGIVSSKTRDRRISIRGQIVAKKFCAAGSRPSRQGVVTILATKPNASSFPAIVLFLCNFTDEDKKPEIVTLFGVLQGVDNRPTVARDLYGTWCVECYVTVRI